MKSTGRILCEEYFRQAMLNVFMEQDRDVLCEYGVSAGSMLR